MNKVVALLRHSYSHFLEFLDSTLNSGDEHGLSRSEESKSMARDRPSDCNGRRPWIIAEARCLGKCRGLDPSRGGEGAVGGQQTKERLTLSSRRQIRTKKHVV